MSAPYVGEIRMFGGNFDPVGWEFCHGQLLPISEYETLFQLIGTTYGGDGQENFALPDLRGRVPMHQGQGPGISQSYGLGGAGGAEAVTLTSQQMPGHNHALRVVAAAATSSTPSGNVLANEVVGNAQAPTYAYSAAAPSANLAAASLTPTGGNQPHTNVQPYTTLNFIICAFGIFPTQT